MARKVFIEAKVNLTLEVDEGKSVDSIMDEFDVDLFGDNFHTDNCEVINYQIKDSK